MIEENDADRRVQIGEYVLGLLEGAERAEVHALIERDPAAAATALAWEDDFLALADRLPPQAPPAAVWVRILTSMMSLSSRAWANATGGLGCRMQP